MRRRLFAGISRLSLALVALCAVLLTAALTQRHAVETQQQTRAQAKLMAAALERGGFDSIDDLAGRLPNSTVTLLSSDGQVLSGAQKVDFAARAVSDAVGRGEGESTGWAGEYRYAVRLAGGQVLLVQSGQNPWGDAAKAAAPALVLAAAAALVLSRFAATRLARSLAIAINDIDLESPLERNAYDELAPLAMRLDRQRTRMQQQMTQLTRQQKEFAAIADQMREGLVVLDASQNLLSANRAAAQLFGLDSNAQGRHVLTVNRSDALRGVVEQAAQGHPAEAILEWGGRSYQLLGNPVLDKQVVVGVVLLLFDVTERRQAEQLRREFSANVSHELKTPLTSIAGYAELLQNGMARGDDAAVFATRIYDEARRLMALIEDIIALSRLDEQQGTPELSPVDLYAAALRAAEHLKQKALDRNVTLSVEGAPVTVMGNPELIDELLFNLCDNAIQYNRDGGRVILRAAAREDGAALEVSDTGIGIPREHQARVFERFYRVDKSHARQTGGTGLGLSIVKHVALMHGAALQLKSEPGKGTDITVLFPPARR